MNNTLFLAMANATFTSINEALDKAEAAFIENQFTKCRDELKLSEILHTSLERTIAKIPQ